MNSPKQDNLVADAMSVLGASFRSGSGDWPAGARDSHTVHKEASSMLSSSALRAGAAAGFSRGSLVSKGFSEGPSQFAVNHSERRERTRLTWCESLR